MSFRRDLAGFDEMSRREFAASMARALLGVGLVPLLPRVTRAEEPDPVPLKKATAQSVIYLYMAGGMSHLDTFDPKPGSPTQGPIKAIRTRAESVLISEHFPHLAEEMDRIAVINSMHSNQGAHVQGRYFIHTSYPLRGTIKHPSMGAWLERMRGRINPTLPGNVLVGRGANLATNGFFDASLAPLSIGNPSTGLKNSERADHISKERFEQRIRQLTKMNRAFVDRFPSPQVRDYGKIYAEALRLMASRDLSAFDVSNEHETMRDAYGDNRFGQGCLLARRLVEKGVRFVEVISDGWDTHADNFIRMAELCRPLDRALATLLADLEARGMLDETLVVLTTEFGRSPDIIQERNLGRDHYPKAFSSLLAGGGIQGGQAYGKTDAEGREVVDGIVRVPDFNATIAYALGLPLRYQVYSASGRPFTVARDGVPIKALF